MVSKYWIQWLCGLGGAALMWCINFIIKKFKKGYMLVKDDEKEDYLADVNKRIKEDEDKLEALKKTVKDSNKEIKDEIEKVLNIIELLQEGILSSHLDSLIQDCKGWIKQGWIPLDLLERFEEKYKLYKDLGGNGHMEPWASRVRELPNKPPKN